MQKHFFLALYLCGSFQRQAALTKSRDASGGSGVSDWYSSSSTLGALGGNTTAHQHKAEHGALTQGPMQSSLKWRFTEVIRLMFV